MISKRLIRWNNNNNNNIINKVNEGRLGFMVNFFYILNKYKKGWEGTWPSLKVEAKACGKTVGVGLSTFGDCHPYSHNNKVEANLTQQSLFSSLY